MLQQIKACVFVDPDLASKTAEDDVEDLIDPSLIYKSTI